MEGKIMQEGMGKYLKIPGSGGESVADRMFRYQNIHGFLPVEITWVNGQKQYVYDISGKVSLEHYVSDAQIGLEDIRHILGQILELPEQLNKYLLDGNGAVIHENDLYVDPRTKEIYAIYNPDSPHQGIPAVARLLEFIMDQMNPQDQELAFFVYGLHRLTKEMGATRQLLKMYLEQSTEKERTTEKETPKKEPKRYGGQKSLSKVERKKNRSCGDDVPSLEQNLLPAVFLALGIMIPLVLWCLGWFTLPVSGETDWVKAAGAAAFFLGAAGYGAWKTRPEKRQQSIWIEEENEKKVCLIPCQGREEPLPIPYYPFVLGSERNRVDGILSAGEVSSVHAQILQEGGGIFVMDEESDSGTFHNDVRLVPWQKTSLKDGDFLRFGQSKYVVEIT